MTVALSILAAALAALLIRSKYAGPRWHEYVSKPLATLSILTLAIISEPMGMSPYRYAILLGLTFSLAGDVLLMLPQDRFVAGLVCFLAAHMAYIVAFSLQAPLFTGVWTALPLLLYVAVMTRILSPHLGRLELPVIVYEIVIALMAWRALAWAATSGSPEALAAAFGAVLFVASDSVLALNRFVRPFASAELLILASYYIAQWLIALSV